MEVARTVIDEGLCPQEGRIPIQSPNEETIEDAYLRVIPCKDIDGSVSIAILFSRLVRG